MYSMFKKHHFVILLFLCFNMQYVLAQKLRSITNFETSTVSYQAETEEYWYLDNINFEQMLYYRRTYNKEFQETDSYYYNSVYFKDSLVGAKLIGIDFNLMRDPFEDSPRLNYFRHWNIIRIGGFFGAEYNPFEGPYPVEESYQYINGGGYIRYYHIKKSARGDKTTKYRRGDWGFFAEGEFKGRVFVDLHVKPFPYLWIHGRYKKEKQLNIKYFALIFEFELNQYGYDNRRAQSNKDLYNGVCLSFGPEYNLYNSSFSLNIGLKMDFRNQ